MKLTVEVVTELSSLRSNIKALQKEEKVLTERVKKAMRGEKISEFGPKTSAMKFCLDKMDKSKVKWKGEWKKLAKRYLSNWKKTEETIIEDSRETEYQLRIELNENYKTEAA